MNIVNIRTAPIKKIHQGGLEVMNKKKRHDTKKMTKKKYRTQGLGRQDIFTSKEEDRRKPERIVTKNRDGEDVSAKINN